MKMISPLRYPGGKSTLYEKVKNIIVEEKLTNKTYVEPFSGGFGLGIKLMTNGVIKNFIINDYDYHIYAFWKVLFFKTKELIKFINDVDVTLEQWEKQKFIYNNYQSFSIIEVACSTFFLNRTNYSGVLKGGPIGGQKQAGKYKIDCRFNKEKLIDLITRISKYKNYVEIYNLDATILLEKLQNRQEHLFYNFDPPYVSKGKELYTNFYTYQNHTDLKNAIELVKEKWIMTYDDNDLIKNLYKNYNVKEYNLTYFAGKKKNGAELFICNF